MGTLWCFSTLDIRTGIPQDHFFSGQGPREQQLAVGSQGNMVIQVQRGGVSFPKVMKKQQI